MTRSISTASPVSRSTPLPATSPVEPPKAPVSSAAVSRGDRLNLGGSRDPLLEADLRLKVVEGPRLLANGQVGFSRTFLERLLKHSLSKGETLSNAQVSFDPTRGAYSVRASAKVKGLNVPFTVELKPEVIGQGVGFKLDNLRIPLGESGRFGIQHQWLTGKVCEELAKELAWSLGAKAHPDQGVVTLDPNAILHHVNALPQGLGIDLARTALRTTVSATGDLTLGMSAAGLAPAADTSEHSDLAVEADAAGLQALLKSVLAPDYEVGKVTLKDGGLTIDGQAEFKDGSDVINAGKVLVALIGLAAGDARAAGRPLEATRLMIPLDLDLTITGTELRVKPSIGKALGELAKTFEAAGLSPVQEGGSLRVDLSAILKDRGRFETMQFRKDGMQVRMKLDLDAFIANPAINGAGG